MTIKKILVIFPFDFSNIYGGGYTRLINDIAVLKSLGHEITLLCPSSGGKPEHFPPGIQTITYKGLSRFLPFSGPKIRLLIDQHSLIFNSSFRKIFSKLTKTHDICFVHYFSAAMPAIFFAKNSIPIIFVDHDFSYDLAIQITNFIPYRKYVHFAEGHACRKAIKVIAVSNWDATKIAFEYGVSPARFKAIPNYIDVKAFHTQTNKQELKRNLGFNNTDCLVLFHGKMSTRPNAEALSFIINELAPTLKESMTECKIIIVGSEIPDYAKKDCNVTCYSDVEDLAMFIGCADIAIVPLIFGGGTRLKILECLASGVPIISTKKGAEGLVFVEGQDILISDRTSSDFIKNIKELRHNPHLQIELSTNGYTLVKKSYSFQMAKLEYGDLLKDASHGNLKSQ